MYAIYNSYGDLVSISSTPDVVMRSVLLPSEITTLEEAISAGYRVGRPVGAERVVTQENNRKAGMFLTRKRTKSIIEYSRKGIL